jgi:hypothetical protein
MRRTFATSFLGLEDLSARGVAAESGAEGLDILASLLLELLEENAQRLREAEAHLDKHSGSTSQPQ